MFQGWRRVDHRGACPSRLRDAQIPTNLAGQMVVDLSVARHRRCPTVRRIDVYAVLASTTQQLAPVRFEVSDQLLSFHDATRTNGSLVTS